ncbi:putative F-box protein At5g15670 [Raphanus sativus]|uniref:F-box protein At5g15670 n=1 Tax=Raphanus sativus TaxID=3726 RepID=A0A9W3C5M6_RAPSA|nr:putative F-box protein At5g15670 [Raphanus sativus]
MMMITRSKKNKTTVTINPQASSYDVLPLDLVMEIIGRLPVKSIARFLLVSKLWATTIRSRDFNKSFPLGSFNSSQPRFLIALSVVVRGEYMGKEDWYFFSSSSFLSRSSCPLPNSYQRIEFRSNYVNGLICIGCGQEQFIVNPTTGSSSEHQVFTLGDKNKSWRMLKCSIIPHRPCSNGLCMDGVIYYAAKTGTGHSLMRFDLRSEKFHLITGVPAEIALTPGPYSSYVMIFNYQGKVAIPNNTSTSTFHVWVMDQNAEDKEQKWLKKVNFSVEPGKNLFNCPHVYIKGITQTTGEFIMVPYSYYSGDVYVVLYNHYTDTFRKIKVLGDAAYDVKRHRGTGIFISDYIESVRFL